MKKAKRKDSDELRPEYDFASMEGSGRGKYASRFKEGTNLVLLDEDLVEAFPSDEAVNDALRAVLRVAKRVSKKTKPPDKRMKQTG